MKLSGRQKLLGVALTTYIIGRSRDCDIVIDDVTVSRRHAELALGESGHFVLTDLDSSGGTFLRGASGWRQIRRAQIALADRIRLGACETTAQDLVSRLGQKSAAPRKRLERDPETGEIVTRFE